LKSQGFREEEISEQVDKDFKVFYNFVRKNARQNLTPADKCGIGLNGNRWENLLLQSIKYNNSLNATGKKDLTITP